MKLHNILFVATLLLGHAAFAQATTHSATATWLDNQNPAGATYNLYRASGLCSGTPAFSKILSAITAKAATDTNLSPGNYCYAVTATVNGSESAQSNTAGAPVPAFSPTNLTITVALLEIDVQSEALEADGVVL